ncbi:MAG TPA: SRPBCC family protein [Rhodanobacteraceae bacterium]|nr:SRPBCC family protein [Rhodanobacteraceae bacterium]
MKNTGTLKVETRGDREIVMTRVFDAPRDLVFDALTTPALLKRWFGPHGWTLTECEVDLRVGGAWRFFSTGPGGRTMGMRGVYREIVRPERILYTESFDDWADQGAALITTTLVERAGTTTLTCVSLAPSREVRDAVIQSGMEHGAAETYDRLADVLGTLATEKTS